MGNDFSSGMKDVMSLFMMSSLAANYDAQRENMAENRELRAANLKRQEAEDKRQTMTADIEMLKLVSNPQNNIPQDVALQTTNKFAVKYGFGNAVKSEDITKYDDELSVLTQQDLPTGEERRALFQPYAERAGTHVSYAAAYGRHAKAIEDWLSKPGATEGWKAVGLSEENAERLLQNVRPSEGLALLKDGDYRKAAILNQAQQDIASVMNGKDVPEGQLQKSLSAAWGAGFKIGPDAAEIVKGTMGEAQYNLAQKDVNSLNVTSVKPLSKLWETIDQEKLTLKVASRALSPSLTTIGLGMDDLVASTLPEEQQKAFHESVAKIEATYDHASKTWKDFEARYKIAKANPNTTQADSILLDQQRMVEQQKYRALIKPFMSYKSYTDAPTSENFNKVAKASEELDNQVRRWEGDKQNILTISEQKTQEEIQTGKVTLATKQATNEFGGRFLELTGQHPEIYDADGTMDISKAGKLATPIVAELNNKYKIQLDASEIVKEFAAAGKRSVPKSDTLEKLTPEQAYKAESAYSGRDTTDAIVKQLIPDGKTVDRKLLLTSIGSGVPWTNGRTLKAAMLDALDEEARARTGAAYPETEVSRFESMFIPKNTDSDKTVIQKLERFRRHFDDKVNLFDPSGVLEKRRKTPKTVGEIVGKGENVQPSKAATPSWNQDMDAKARALIKKNPDWSVDQLYKALQGGE